MRTVKKFSNCYEGLVKEFIVNLSSGCADGRSADFKTELSQSDMFDPRLQAKILNVVDVS